MSLNTLFGALVFVLLYNIFFFGVSLNIGFGFLFLLLNCYFLFTKNSNNNLTFGIICSTLAIIFAFLFGFRDSGVVQVINFLLAVFLTFSAIYFYKNKTPFHFSVLALIFTPLSLVLGVLSTLLGINKLETPTLKIGNEETSKGITKGLLIAVPLFLILLFILTQADPVFNKFTSDFFGNIGERGAVSFVIFTVLFILGIGGITELFKSKLTEDTIGNSKIHELSIILGSISTLFGLFILVQFNYLFSNVGERGLHKLGIQSLTFSEYINKGFFELLIASSIAVMVLVYTFRSLHKLNSKKLIQFFAGLLTIETGPLLLSAAKRDFMYADEHGLTRARIFGFLFLIWLMLILITFFVRVFINFKPATLFTSFAVITLFSALMLSFINVDELIAIRYKPTVNNEIDYVYISTLSTDGYLGWKDALHDSIVYLQNNQKDLDISSEDSRRRMYNLATLGNLSNTGTFLILKYGTQEEIVDWFKDENLEWMSKFKESGDVNALPEDVRGQRVWQDFNFSEYQAYRYIVENKDLFFQIPQLYKQTLEQTQQVPSAVRENTPIDRSLDTPLNY